jgi:hypothetical protein
MNQQLSAVGLLTPSLTGSVEADLVFNDGVLSPDCMSSYAHLALQSGRITAMPSVEHSEILAYFPPNAVGLTQRCSAGTSALKGDFTRYATRSPVEDRELIA